MPAGTTFRFLLLISALLGASVFVYNTVYLAFAPGADRAQAAYEQCSAAAGRTGEDGRTVDYLGSFLTCTAEVERTKAPWVVAGVVLLLALAGLLYWAEPRVQVRKHGLVAFAPGDAEGAALVRLLHELVAEAGLRRPPRFFLRRSWGSVTARAFGRAGWYAVVLDAGLVMQFRPDPARLRALVLHELAHLRNRDTDIACLTRSLNWAFLPLGVLPLAVGLIGIAPGDALGVGLRAAVLLGLVLLTSQAVLRSREHGADVRAASWSGVRQDLLAAIAVAVDIRRPWWKGPRNFHPTKEQRIHLVHHPDQLFRIGFWECCAAGLAAMSAGSGFLILWWLTVHEADPLQSRWAAALVVSPAVAAVVGLGAWRTAARSDGTVREIMLPALGLTVGLVLGRALAVNSGMETDSSWPFSSGDPAALLPALSLAAVLVLFTWWATQVAVAWGAPAGAAAPRRTRWAVGWVAASLILSVTIALWTVLTDTADWLTTIGEGVSADHRAVAQVAPAGPYWLWSAVHHPLLLRFAQWTPLALALVTVWAVPLAARLRAAPRQTRAAGSVADTRTGVWSDWPFVVTLACLAATAAFIGGTLVSRLLIHSGIPERTRTMDGFLHAFTHGNLVAAMLLQGLVALATAALLVRRHGSTAALYGLMAAFLTGCLVTAVFFGGVLAAGCVDALALRPAECGGIALPFVRNTLLRILLGGTACSLIALTAGAVALSVRRRLRRTSRPQPAAEALAHGMVYEGRLTARRVGLSALLLAGSVALFACTTDPTDRPVGPPMGGIEEVRSACRQYDELLGSLDALTTAEVHTRLDEASQLAVRGREPALALAFTEHFRAALEGDAAAFEAHGERIEQRCATAGVVLVNLP
ncbi:M48 family metalloprotease [Streptomyces sp. NBC_00249]|uniref:M48 family metalloprotease n=1 Tax=Streptomyces sp. NBC_00249 TaxID=2975690 RepID=UPI002252AD30|nr:M48 family metalloprotease [Streptomyces sp. NBC_00249]MCX5199759.1 M48 family metalloprotease [Streptomyces sp. NBC_00249]